MTKYQRKELETVKERWIASKTVCDFCSRNVDDIGDSGYDATEVTIDAKIGSYYPEADCREAYRVDVCSECFVSKVKPAIEALGVKWHEYSPDEAYPSAYSKYYTKE